MIFVMFWGRANNAEDGEQKSERRKAQRAECISSNVGCRE